MPVIKKMDSKVQVRTDFQQASKTTTLEFVRVLVITLLVIVVAMSGVSLFVAMRRR